MFWNVAKLLGNLGDSFDSLRLAFKMRAAFNLVLIFTHYWGNTLLSILPMPHVLQSFLTLAGGNRSYPYPSLSPKDFCACSFLVILPPTLCDFLKCIYWSELSWRCKGTLPTSRAHSLCSFPFWYSSMISTCLTRFSQLRETTGLSLGFCFLFFSPQSCGLNASVSKLEQNSPRNFFFPQESLSCAPLFSIWKLLFHVFCSVF